jgi:plastocyanin
MPLIRASVLLLLGSLVLPSAERHGVLMAQSGTLEGQVLLSPRISARRPRFRLYTEYGQAATVTAPPDTNEMANVIIYLDSAAFNGSAPDSAPEMRQVNETFKPHVLAIVAGSSVDFPNEDPFFHNVFSLSRPKSFDLGRYPQGSSKRIRFDREGVVPVFCHIHSDMSGIVFVAPNRFFISPGVQGSYRLEGIPPGTYRITAWHERAKPVKATVRIEPGKTSRLDFNIPITNVESASN